MSRKPRTKAAARKPKPAARPAPAKGLLRDPAAARPLASLVFLSPLLIFYVIGLIWVRPDLVARADILIREGLHLLGLSGYLAPTWMVVLILLLWHIVRRDPWEVPWSLLGMMALETLILAVPLLVIYLVFHAAAHGVAPLDISGAAGARHWLDAAMTCIGAGIFEELLFRLLMVGGTLFILRLALKEESPGAMVAVVLIAAAVFSGAHVLDHPESFVWNLFLFRAAAGIYLGFTFFYRGFGVTTGVHVVFNLVLETAALLRHTA
jgi:hypothetical protein